MRGNICSGASKDIDRPRWAAAPRSATCGAAKIASSRTLNDAAVPTEATSEKLTSGPTLKRSSGEHGNRNSSRVSHSASTQNVR